MYATQLLTLQLVKKVIVILLCVLYLASASGTTLSMHFCMGKLVGSDFGNQHREKCPRCGMTEKAKKGCCKNEIKTFKNAEHKASKTNVYIGVGQPVVLPIKYSDQCQAFAGARHTVSDIQKPPIYPTDGHLYLRFRNLRI